MTSILVPLFVGVVLGVAGYLVYRDVVKRIETFLAEVRIGFHTSTGTHVSLQQELADKLAAAEESFASHIATVRRDVAEAVKFLEDHAENFKAHAADLRAHSRELRDAEAVKAAAAMVRQVPTR